MQFGGSMGELIDASNIVLLADAMADRGFSVNPEMVKFYEDKAADYAPTRASGGNVVMDYVDQGAKIGEVPVSEYDAALLGDYKDAAVIVLGRDAGESCCFYPGANGLLEPEEFTGSPTGNIFSLSNEERDLINWTKEQGFGRIIVLPSGHLPDTFAVNTALSPAAQNTGIYVFANAEEITDMAVDWTGEEDSTVTVKVTNTGSQAAKHAVQLYVSLPYTDNDRKNGVEKSAIQLIGYTKTGEAEEKADAAAAAEPLTVTSDDGATAMTFNADGTCVFTFEAYNVEDAGTWTYENGKLTVTNANGAAEALQ